MPKRLDIDFPVSYILGRDISKPKLLKGRGTLPDGGVALEKVFDQYGNSVLLYIDIYFKIFVKQIKSHVSNKTVAK